MKKWGYAALALAFVVLLVYGGNLSPWRPTFNRTNSLPIGLYWAVSPVKALHRNDKVCFLYHEPEWARGRYLPEGSRICKEVMGVPGDVVVQNGDSLTLVHGTSRVSLGVMLHADSKGRPVPARRWGTLTIPPGQYYLGSTRTPKSFDSRYLGLIPKQDIVDRIYPLIAF